MKPEIRKPTEDERKEAHTWPTWSKEAGEFPWQYDEKETCLILDGNVTVTNETGEKFNFGAGDWVVFPQGMKCTWKVNRPVRKHYNFGE
ncbi:MAG TPA: cupin domain-containing protein [Phycisphaerae bacterium]|nr:cupin domain-containing protein [Phycisphaerae bacterium]HRR83494.1 cupin domain-containing protein [Phycisphaerae bacterium]